MHKILVVALFLLTTACGGLAADETADLIILNGQVYTADGGSGFQQAVAVKGAQIVAVGSNEAIERWRGPETQVIDAGGGAVTPGLIDSHVHFLPGAATLDQLSLSGVADGAELSERFARFVAEQPDRAWYEGHGYVPDRIGRADIDRATGEKPAIIRVGDGHSIIANSRALALAGIDRNTPDPVGGRIVRDARGEPTGHLLETAQGLVFSAMPEATRAERRRLLELGTDAAHAAGVTTLVAVGGTDELALFQEARAEGELGLRIAMALWLTQNAATSEIPESFAFTPADADRFDTIRAGVHKDKWLKLDLVKIMSDGVIESHTAAMLEPYRDDPSTMGIANYPPEELARVIGMMDGRGWHIMTHALGDRAVRVALDAYEQAAAANPAPAKGRRHKIEHIEAIHPDDIPRFRQLGVTASLQPAHARGMNDPEMRARRWKVLDYETSAWGFPWKSILDSGGRVAFGSDWPVAPLNIGSSLETATGRIAQPPVPQQQLTVAQTIDGYTREAAWSIFVDQDRGTLTPGKLADIVVFADDIFSKPADGADLPVRFTIVDGNLVYQAAGD